MKTKIYRTIIFPVVLHGYETWSLTLRKEYRLKVFESMVLRRIFGPKSDEVSGKWRKLQSEELHYMYSSPNIIRVTKSRRMRWVGHVACKGNERRKNISVGTPEGYRELGRARRRWEDNIKMYL
jgi:hypothetical protein